MNEAKKESDFCTQNQIVQSEKTELTVIFSSTCPITQAENDDVPVRDLMTRYDGLKEKDIDPDITRSTIDTLLSQNQYPTSEEVSEDEWKNNFAETLNKLRLYHSKKESDFCARDYIGKEDEEEFTAVFRSKCPVALHATFDVPVRQLMERFHYLESLDVEPDSTRLAIDSVLRMHDYPTSDKVKENMWENNFEKLLEEMESRNEIKKIKRYGRPYGMPSL